MKAEQLTGACATHGEGPVWDAAAGRLRWVDMFSGDVLTLDPAGAVERLHVGSVVAAVRPRVSGGLVVAVERGFTMLDPGGRPVRHDTAFNDAACRMNDGGTDRQGRFFCGSMAYNMADPRAALYRYDPDGAISTVLTGVTVSNGIAWSLDGAHMYYIDSATQQVEVFDYDTALGIPARRQPLARVATETGMPDGLALDDEGGVWVALWRGAAVHRYGPDGRLDVVIDLPVELVTACAFGGPGLDELYITTSRQGLTAAGRAAGALFTARPGVRGLPCTAFAG
ncbi:MAG TPA: SMP-30/gluconolactonase/LRE family protein [Streptosporangiaceae bacterium]|nr:SMP-30/gluconolactonase/LRE family protein [Streptosporangiaceae bacterium]